MRCPKKTIMFLLCVCLVPVNLLPDQNPGSNASGGGTYFVEPGIRSEFQFGKSHVQCKIGHSVLRDGTVLQMLMFSRSTDSVTIDSTGKKVVITGRMVSIVNLRFTNGATAELTETVPYTVYAEDNGTPGGGTDFFALTVEYTDTPDLDQFDLFGSPATFSGLLESGNIVVR